MQIVKMMNRTCGQQGENFKQIQVRVKLCLHKKMGNELKTKKPLIFKTSGACCLDKSVSFQVFLQSLVRDNFSTWVFLPRAIFQWRVNQRFSLW